MVKEQPSLRVWPLLGRWACSSQLGIPSKASTKRCNGKRRSVEKALFSLSRRTPLVVSLSTGKSDFSRRTKACYQKRSLLTHGNRIAQSVFEMQTLWPHSELLHQNLHFNSFSSSPFSPSDAPPHSPKTSPKRLPSFQKLELSPICHRKRSSLVV